MLRSAEETSPSRSSRRQTYIQLRMDSLLEEARQRRQRRWLPSLSGWAPSGRLQESVTRCVNFLRFSCVCCAGAVNAMAPWALAAAEACTVLLIYFLAVPDALWVHVDPRQYSYSFDSSCEDVVALSLLRFVVVLGAYLLGTGPLYQRPYLYAAMASAALYLPFVLLKSALLQHSHLHRAQWPSHLAVYATNAGFSVLHMVAANRVVSWARSRYEMGLLGFGYPWEEGEQTWLLAGRLGAGGLRAPAPAAADAERGTSGIGAVLETTHDVPARELADEDSIFLEDCQGLTVHCKMALPQGSVEPGEAAIMLVHGFGGGTFSWRHIMQPLADDTGLAVVAFDRPGFGLTSRPEVAPKTPLVDNPYSLKSQAVLTLKLAWQLGLRRVLLVGHEDGALVALMASAMACREEQRFSFSPHTSPDRGVTAAGAPPARAIPFPITLPSPLPVPQPTIPQSMDGAWEGWLAREGSKGFLQRLLRGDFSPSPTNSPLLDGASMAAARAWAGGQAAAQPQQPCAQPWLAQPWQQAPWRQRLLLGRRSLDSFDWHEDGREPVWWARPRHPGPPGYPAMLEQCEAECPLLPRSTDTSPPHSVGSRRHHTEAAWGGEEGGGAQGLQQAALHGLHQQQQQPAQQQQQQQQQRLPSPLGPGAAPGGSSAGRSLHQQLMAAARSNGDVSCAGPALAGAAAAPAQQVMPEAQARASSAHGSANGSHPHLEQQQQQQQQQPPDIPAGLPPVAEAGEEPSTPPHMPTAAAAVSGSQHHRHQGFWGEPAAAAQPGSGQEEATLWHVPGWQLPLVVGLVLLHPDLSGQVAPRYARVLASSRLGRGMLRALLRTEVGEVSNRRAWCDDSHLSPELLALYKRPLQVEDWDKALIEVCRAKNQLHWVERSHLLGALGSCGLPVLVMTGERDHMSTPAAAAALSERLPGSRLAVLPGCGHLAHEERPQTLLDFLAAFVRDVAAAGGAGAGQQQGGGGGGGGGGRGGGGG